MARLQCTCILKYNLLQLVQKIDDVFDAAIQCAVQRKLPIILLNAAVLQSILKNATLQLPALRTNSWH